MALIPQNFRDANYQTIPYDGTPISWRVSVYGMCINDNSLLLVKHRDEKFWDIPGGGIEMGESLAEALSRESAEEAGWQLHPTKPVTTLMDWFYHQGEKNFYRSLQMFWLASGTPLQIGPSDPKIEKVSLVRLDQLNEYQLYPNVLEALKLVLPD